MAPLVATAKHGRPMAVIRIFEWSITVPFLLSLVGASCPMRCDAVQVGQYTLTFVFGYHTHTHTHTHTHNTHTHTMHAAWLVDKDSKRVARLRTRQVLCLIVGGFGPLFV